LLTCYFKYRPHDVSRFPKIEHVFFMVSKQPTRRRFGPAHWLWTKRSRKLVSFSKGLERCKSRLWKLESSFTLQSVLLKIW
jgi:hypothetical protein